MELDRGERQRVDDARAVEQLRVALVGQAEDEVRAHGDAACGRRLDGASCRGEVVAPVDRAQRGVGGRFDAVLDADVGAAGEVGQIVQLGRIHAVGTGAHDDPRDAGAGERLPEEPLEPFERCIGIAVRLEVDQESRSGRKPAPVEGDRVVDLLPDGAARVAVGGREGLVRAERTAAVSYRAVAVGAGETSVDRKFLYRPAEGAAAVGRIAVIGSCVAPGVHVRVENRFFCFIVRCGYTRTAPRFDGRRVSRHCLFDGPNSVAGVEGQCRDTIRSSSRVCRRCPSERWERS